MDPVKPYPPARGQSVVGTLSGPVCPEAVSSPSGGPGSLVDIPDLYFALDEHGVLIDVNASVAALGYRRRDWLGRFFGDWIHPDDRNRILDAYCAAVSRRTDFRSFQQFRIVSKDGRPLWFEAHSSIWFTADKVFRAHAGICRDITPRIRGQEALEKQIGIRTAELLGANEALRKEIAEHREAEQVLRDREADLQMEKMHLQEANTALKVLLKRRDADRRELEEQVAYNVMKLILPYLDKLRMNMIDAQQLACLSIIEANLNDITAGFARRLSLEQYNLTAAELKVANFIRQGKRSREIAHLMAVSRRTVEVHRQRVRHKLRIRNKKVNLRTFLMAIA